MLSFTLHFPTFLTVRRTIGKPEELEQIEQFLAGANQENQQANNNNNPPPQEA